MLPLIKKSILILLLLFFSFPLDADEIHLDWYGNADSVQGILYHALHELAKEKEKFPSGSFLRVDGNTVTFKHGLNSIICKKGKFGYNAKIDIRGTAASKWSSKRSSIQALLYKALLRHSKNHDGLTLFVDAQGSIYMHGEQVQLVLHAQNIDGASFKSFSFQLLQGRNRVRIPDMGLSARLGMTTIPAEIEFLFLNEKASKALWKNLRAEGINEPILHAAAKSSMKGKTKVELVFYDKSFMQDPRAVKLTCVIGKKGVSVSRKIGKLRDFNKLAGSKLGIHNEIATVFLSAQLQETLQHIRMRHPGQALIIHHIERMGPLENPFSEPVDAVYEVLLEAKQEKGPRQMSRIRVGIRSIPIFEIVGVIESAEMETRPLKSIVRALNARLENIKIHDRSLNDLRDHELRQLSDSMAKKIAEALKRRHGNYHLEMFRSDFRNVALRMGWSESLIQSVFQERMIRGLLRMKDGGISVPRISSLFFRQLKRAGGK